MPDAVFGHSPDADKIGFLVFFCSECDVRRCIYECFSYMGYWLWGCSVCGRDWFGKPLGNGVDAEMDGSGNLIDG